MNFYFLTFIVQSPKVKPIKHDTAITPKNIIKFAIVTFWNISIDWILYWKLTLLLIQNLDNQEDWKNDANESAVKILNKTKWNNMLTLSKLNSNWEETDKKLRVVFSIHETFSKWSKSVKVLISEAPISR